MKVIHYFVLLLLVIGALNWGLVGFFQYDLVAHIFGGMFTMGARVIYSLVGLAGVYGIGLLFCCGCRCGCKCNHSCNNCKKDKES